MEKYRRRYLIKNWVLLSIKYWDSKPTGPQSGSWLKAPILAASPHAHHLFKLDLDLPVNFSHLKKHLPCRERTKKGKAMNKKRGRGGPEREKSDIKSFQSFWHIHPSCKKQTMQPQRTDERQVRMDKMKCLPCYWWRRQESYKTKRAMTELCGPDKVN